MRVLPALLTLVAVHAAGPVTSAVGLEFLGLRLFEDQADRDAAAVIADPQPYAVDLVIGADAAVEAAVRGASALLADAAEPASGTAGLLAKARGDYRRIMGALYGEGRYGGSVSILVNGIEATRLAPDAPLPDPVAVRIRVEPGPLFRFGRLRVANAASPAIASEDAVEAPAGIGFAPGEVARSTLVARTEELLLTAWRQQGYPKAEIARREVIADHASRTVDVEIVVEPGGRAAIGDVAVVGTEAMDPAFVREQAGLAHGEEYDPDAIARAHRRLARLDVFGALRLEAAQAIGEDGILPYAIVVEEQPQRRFGVGAAYATTEGLGVEGFWLHRNLFGRAERLRLDARVAGIGYPVDTAEFDYAFGGTFTKPGFLTPDTDLVAAVAAERTVLEPYTETSASARAGLTHLLSDEITLEGAAQYEFARFDDDFGTRQFSTAGILGGITLDTRDSPADATAGWFASAVLEPFYEFSYGNPALRATVEGRTYFAFAEDDAFVLAGRFKAGVLLGPALAEIPPDRLFFAGGGGSVRGYGYRSIGVEGPGGLVTGGRYLLEASLEARARFENGWGAVAFLDGGYVAADTFPGLQDLRLGAGVGLRYDTGFGPLRLDLAVPLNRRPGDPEFALYAGIGQAF